MDADALVIPISLSASASVSVQSYALTDSGASAMAFIDESFARQQGLKLQPLRHSRNLNVVDGRSIVSGALTHKVTTKMSIRNHEEEISMFVTHLGHYPVVLGIKWLQQHDATTKWAANMIIFNSPYCKRNCLKGETSTIVTGIIDIPDDLETRIPLEPTTAERPLNISMIGAAPFAALSKKKDHEVFAISLHDINKALEPRQEVDPATVVHSEYHDLLDAFNKKEAAKLPPHRSYDHKIELMPGTTPPKASLRGMSHNELLVMKKYLEENLSKGFIRVSSSAAAAPTLFVKKPGGGLRLCVDYRGLNAISIKDRYPLPLIRETLDRLSAAKFFTKLDIVAAFNRLRMAEGEEWKTAFITRYGLFESLVVPFGLHGAPATFQRYINDVLRDFLDVFATAYMDDVLIYSNTLEEHKVHVRRVITALRDAGLQIDASKCAFHVDEVLYLGLIVGRHGVKMDPKKVEAVRNWPVPKHKKDVQAFLGFANFYRRFIKGFSAIAAPLTALTGSKAAWSWTKRCQDAFEELRDAFCTAPILALFDPELDNIVETDASDNVSAGVFSQLGRDGIIRPVAYFSKKHSPAECNYEIYDKELLAVILAFQEWRAELEGAPGPVKILSDHKNLEYFMTTKMLNRRQARWAEYLSRFNFKIEYRPGKLGAKPDALTRRSQDLPKEGDARLEYRKQVLLKPHHIATTEFMEEFGSTAEDEDDLELPLEDAIRQAYEADAFAKEILDMLRKGATQSKKITLGECRENNDQLWYQGRLYVPDNEQLRTRVCRAHHDMPAAGHAGRTKTLELVRRSFFWPQMRDFVARYVRNCHTCAKSKTRRHAKYGVLKPLPVPNGRWKDISMDFVTGLPESEGHNAILVVVDRLTKMRHFIPTTTDASAETVADLYVNHVYRLHGFPKTVVSDRGPQFSALFWKLLCRRLRTERLLSTAFHPETDGQTEISNAGMEQYLRAYTTYSQDDWAKWLGLAEFAANNAFSEPIQCSPFYANYGYNPCIGFEPRSTLAKSSLPAEIKADEYANHMEDLLEVLRTEMSAAQAKYEDDANRHREPAPAFKVGDQVWLDARNIRTKRPARKLDWKNLGRFSVKRVLSPWAYELELPETMKVHPVFHVSLLTRVADDPLPGQVQPSGMPIEVEGDISYEVEDIYDSKRVQGGHVRYLVKWVGYDAPTWEPVSYVDGAEEMLETFHRLYPGKPRPKQAPRGARHMKGGGTVTAQHEAIQSSEITC